MLLWVPLDNNQAITEVLGAPNLGPLRWPSSLPRLWTRREHDISEVWVKVVFSNYFIQIYRQCQYNGKNYVNMLLWVALDNNQAILTVHPLHLRQPAMQTPCQPPPNIWQKITFNARPLQSGRNTILMKQFLLVFGNGSSIWYNYLHTR